MNASAIKDLHYNDISKFSFRQVQRERIFKLHK